MDTVFTCKQCEFEKIKRENPGKFYDCWWRGHTCRLGLVYRQPNAETMNPAMKDKYIKAKISLENSWLITKLSDTESDL